MLVCKEEGCGVELNARHRLGLCRRHYYRMKKRALYALRKAHGYTANDRVGIYDMLGPPVRKGKQRIRGGETGYAPIPAAGEVFCTMCGATFTTDVPLLDVLCVCGSHRVSKVTASAYSVGD